MSPWDPPLVSDERSTTLVRRQLGRRLRSLREASGKSIEDVTSTSIVSRSKLHRIETGRSMVRRGDVLALAHLYGVDLTRIDDLLAMADATKATGFQEDYGSSVPEWVGLYGDLEAGAAVLRDYSPELIHGLLQTEAYARAVTQVNTSLAPDVVEQRVAFRMRRQRAFFDRPVPGRLEVVITAGAAELAVGSPSVMEEQIAHIRAIVEGGMASVSVLTRTNGLHSAMRGPFTIMDFEVDEDPSLVYLENLIGSRYVERPEQVAEFRAAFERIRALGVPFEEWAR
jgi:transcriptional regulator with XRE-family HTH domain